MKCAMLLLAFAGLRGAPPVDARATRGAPFQRRRRATPISTTAPTTVDGTVATQLVEWDAGTSPLPTAPPTAGPTSAPTTLAPTTAGPGGINGPDAFCDSFAFSNSVRTPLSNSRRDLLPDGGDGVEEIWWRFQAAVPGNYTFATCDSGFDTWVYIYHRTADGRGAEVTSCNDCGPCGVYAAPTTHLEPGDYWIVTTGDPDAAVPRGEVELRISCPIFTEEVTELECGATVQGALPHGPSLVGEVSGDAFFTVHAPHDGIYTLSACSSTQDGASNAVRFIEVYRLQNSSTPTTGAWVEHYRCNDCGECPDAGGVQMVVPLTAGTYGIVFDSDTFAGVPFTATLQCPAAPELIHPPADGVVSCGAGPTTGTTVGGVSLLQASTVLSSESTAAATAPERWFEFTAPYTGQYTFDTCGSALDTYLHLFGRDSASNGRGDVVAESDQRGSGCDSVQQAALIGIDLVAGETYWIVVDAIDNRAGDFTLSVSCPALQCGAVVEGTTRGGTMLDPTQPSPERFFAFTAPATDYYTFDTCLDGRPLGFTFDGIADSDLKVIQRRGSATDLGDPAADSARGFTLGSCSLTGCQRCTLPDGSASDVPGRGSLGVSLVAGKDYWVVVQGNHSHSGEFELAVQCGTNSPTSAPTPSSSPTRAPTPAPTRAPTRGPTPPPPPPPAAEPSCISGSALVERVDEATGDATAVQVRDLARGDTVRGAAGDTLRPTTCTIAAIGYFGYGAFYGDYTDHHYLLNNATKSVVAAGTRNLTATDDDKFVILLGEADDEPNEGCLAGVDANAQLYTPLDTDFCGHGVTLSFADYKMLYAFILRTVRSSGAFWLNKASYTSRIAEQPDGSMRVQQWHDATPQLCRTMLQCARSADAASAECALYEAVGAQFVDGFMTPGARHATHEAFPNLGSSGGGSGTAAGAAMDDGPMSDSMPWRIAAVVLSAALLIVIVVGAAVVWRRRRQGQSDNCAAVAAANEATLFAVNPMPAGDDDITSIHMV